MTKKCALIYNPKASGFKRKTFQHILEAIKEEGFFPIPIESTSASFLSNNIGALNEQFNIILTMGGDGTVSTAYEAFHQLDGNQKAIYGHIPAGTTNDMGPNTFVPRYNPVKATKKLLNGPVEHREIITINNNPIAYVGAMGILAPVTYLIDKSNDKKDTGTFSYIRYGAYQLFTNPELYQNIVKEPYQITYETSDKKIHTKVIFIAIFNGRSFANLRINPRANMCDNNFEVAIVHKPSELLPLLARSFFAPNGIMNANEQNTFSTDYLKLTFENKTPYYPINCDGDPKELLEGTNELEVKATGKILQLTGRRK